jgi:hypothetical protein
MERKEFTLCEKCAAYEKPSDFLYVSSADFSMCADCKTYGETPVVREFPVELLSVEECDCIEKHDRIQHNNGGNYHLTTYQVLHDVIDSDMSDEEYDDALAETNEQGRGDASLI